MHLVPFRQKIQCPSLEKSMIEVVSILLALFLSGGMVQQEYPETDQYSFASQRLLSDQDLRGYSKTELKIMRNAIFARHGFIFRTPEMREYFLRQPWYTPSTNDVSNLLSPIERANIDLIKQREAAAVDRDPVMPSIAQVSPAGERCYSSTNSRGEAFLLHIAYGPEGSARSIRYRDKTTSIPLSYGGQELVSFPEFNVRINANTYLETYNGKTTGKLYLLERRLETGIGVVFQRSKDGQFFYFADCVKTPTVESANRSVHVEVPVRTEVPAQGATPSTVTQQASTELPQQVSRSKDVQVKSFNKSMILRMDKSQGSKVRKP